MSLPPQNLCVEVLTLSTPECDLIWSESLYKGNQVKMKLLGWAVIQYD